MTTTSLATFIKIFTDCIAALHFLCSDSDRQPAEICGIIDRYTHNLKQSHKDVVS